MPGSLTTPALTPPASNPTASGLLRRATPKFATTLSAAINSTATTIPLTAVTGISTDSAVTIVIDPLTDKEEVIIGFPESNNLVNCVRHVEGATIAHDNGAVVMMISTAIDHNSIIDAIRAEHDKDGKHSRTALQLIANPAGVILQFAGPTAPTGYLLCDGSSVAEVDFPALFTAIGAAYGSASAGHFNLPDLRGRVPVGKNAAGTFASLGGTGGEETHILTTAEIPAHTHVQNAHNHGINDPGHSHGLDVGGGFGAGPGNSSRFRADLNSPAQTWGNGSIGVSGTGISIQNATPTNQNAGGGLSHNNLQPYIVLNHIIKT